MIVSIEEKNRNDFIIVVTVAGIFHGCIGDEIFPLLFRTVREDTRVMKSCRTHRWIRFLHFPLPPILSLIFVVVHQPADFAGSPCTFHAVNSKI